MKTQLPSKYPWKPSREALGVRKPQGENQARNHGGAGEPGP